MLTDIIECRKIIDIYECSVSIVCDGRLIKFNEGHFSNKEKCLEECVRFCYDRISNGIPFYFYVS